MTANLNELPSIKIFISYVRKDDETFDIVDPLTRHLKQTITGMSGRPVEIFIDRESIPLGSAWEDKLDSAVRSAYFFVPIYTGNYLQSNACREEFLHFREASIRRNAGQLIVPIIWFGLISLRPEGEDEISDYIRKHQSIIFDDARIEGPKSAAYQKEITRLSNRILEVSSDIDDALAEVETDEQSIDDSTRILGTTPIHRDIHGETSDEDDHPGLLESASAFSEEIAELSDITNDIANAMGELSKISEPSEAAKKSPASMSRHMILVANTLSAPAREIEAKGLDLLARTKKCDGYLREIVRAAISTESPDLISSVHASLAGSTETLPETLAVVEQLEGLLNSMKTIEGMSAAVRRALKPARIGIVAVQDTVGFISGWPKYAEQLGDADDAHSQHLSKTSNVSYQNTRM